MMTAIEYSSARSGRIRWARWGRALALLLGVACSSMLAHPSRSFASEAELFLSWRAPYGMPRAMDGVVAACDDTGRVDTLYLSFLVDRSRPGLDSMSAVVYFDPQPGDTLKDFWSFKSGTANGGNMFIEFAPFSDVPCEPPWNGIGDASVSYDSRTGRGRLELSFAVPDYAVVGLDEEVPYCFARVRIHHRRASLPGCTQSVCAQWGMATLFFATGRELEIDHGPHRFATWNSTGAAGCGPQRALATPKPWRPRAPGITPLVKP